jgi:hypothetical protein
MQSMSLTLVAVAKREDMIDLSYEETVGDPSPFVLTVTPQHVAHQTSKPLPLSGSDLEEFILTNVTRRERSGHGRGLPRPWTSRRISSAASTPDIVLPISSGGIAVIILALSVRPSPNGTPGARRRTTAVMRA